MHATDIIGYTADADTYCPECAALVYDRRIDGVLRTVADERPAFQAIDHEGNTVSPIFASDELTAGTACARCGEVLSEEAGQELTGDAAIIAGAVQDWQSGYPISDGQARVIAAVWHGGQTSPLYMLASTGTVRPSVLSNIEREIASQAGPEREELEALLAYCERIGARGPVDGWSRLWGDK